MLFTIVNTTDDIRLIILMNDDETKEFRLKIRGMTCDSCAAHVRKALTGVDGVIRVELPDWKIPHARVIVSPKTEDEKLIRAVRGAGYDARLEEETLPDESVKLSTDHYNDYDLVVIGTGSAGVAASIRAAELGFKVAIIEHGVIGGTCVNIGCVPSKTLFRAAKRRHHAMNNPFEGIVTSANGVDWAKVRDGKDTLVSDLRKKKYVDVLSTFSDNIDLFQATARFTNKGYVHLSTGETLAQRRVIIATGARPRILDIPGVSDIDVFTSTSIMASDTLPSSIIIIGGRSVALELGQTLLRLGTDVTLVQRSEFILPDHEPEIREGLTESLRKEGMRIVTGAVPLSVRKHDQSGNILLTVRTKSGVTEIEAERLMMAVGRTPNTDDLNIGAVGVRLDKRGFIMVDSTMRSSNPNIYAAGDVTTHPKFVYVAAAGGQIAAQNALTTETEELDLGVLPSVVFTDPQVATVGLTESAAKNAGYATTSSTLPLEHVPRALAARDTNGLIKVVIDSSSRRLLGVSILAAEAGEVIQTGALAIAMGAEHGFTVDQLRKLLFPYLTQVEGLKLALLSLDRDVSQLSCCAG